MNTTPTLEMPLANCRMLFTRYTKLPHLDAYIATRCAAPLQQASQHADSSELLSVMAAAA